MATNVRTPENTRRVEAKRARRRHGRAAAQRHVEAAVDRILQVLYRKDAELLANGFVPPARPVHHLDDDAGKGEEYNLYRHLLRNLDNCWSRFGSGVSANRWAARELLEGCVEWCHQLRPYSCSNREQHTQQGPQGRCNRHCNPEIADLVGSAARSAGFLRLARKLNRTSR